MPTAPAGFSPDPSNPGWWLKDGGDPTQDSSWWQESPAGWIEDPNSPGWIYNPQGDVTRPENWWHEGRVQPSAPMAPAGNWYDPVFARARALYGGTPYVFGGDRQAGVHDSPGWDCVGYVMECLDAAAPPLGDFKTGLNQGYINAERARQACPVISAADVQPGDLIFFQKTYDTVGASHIGLVLDPVRKIMADDHQRADGTGPGETNYGEAYWTQHFLSFGRVPR